MNTKTFTEKALYRFANGKVWLIEGGYIEGTVWVSLDVLAKGVDPLLDAISEAATGSIVGLMDITWRIIGQDVVSFSGRIDTSCMEEDEMPVLMDMNDISTLMEMLKAQYHLSDEEARHAAENRELILADIMLGECVNQLSNGRVISGPAYASECDYIRVSIDGWLLATFPEEEFTQDAAFTCGALLGASRGPIVENAIGG